jgi:hypothetical protein
MALGGEDFMSDDTDFRNLLADVPLESAPEQPPVSLSYPGALMIRRPAGKISGEEITPVKWGSLILSCRAIQSFALWGGGSHATHSPLRFSNFSNRALASDESRWVTGDTLAVSGGIG